MNPASGKKIMTISTDDKPLPHSIDAEKHVLGAMINFPESSDVAFNIIGPEGFYRTEHQELYKAIQAAGGIEWKHDLVILGNYLKSSGKMNAVGGWAYVRSCYQGVVTDTLIKHHAQIVAEKAARRNVILQAQQLRDEAWKEDSDITETCVKYLEPISTAAFRAKGAVSVQVGHDSIEHWMDHCKGHGGYPMEFRNIARHMATWAYKRVYVLAARPGTGKTTLMRQVCLNHAQQNRPVIWYSVEEPLDEFQRNLAASMAQVNRKAVERGTVQGYDLEKFEGELDALKRLPFYFSEYCNDLFELMSDLKRRKTEMPSIGLCVVDYTQLITVKGNKRREQEIATVSRKLKQTAMELNLCIVAVAQLNRQCEIENRPPRLSDLRESGSIEQDADAVIFLHQGVRREIDGKKKKWIKRDEATGERLLSVLCPKTRLGDTFAVELAFDGAAGKFRQYGEDRTLEETEEEENTGSRWKPESDLTQDSVPF